MSTKRKDQVLAPAMGVTERHARRRIAEGSATPSAMSDRERWEKARADKTELEAERQRVELQTQRAELIPAGEIAAHIRAIGEELKSSVGYELEDQLPIINEGLSAEKQRENNRAAFLRILARWREFADKHGA